MHNRGFGMPGKLVMLGFYTVALLSPLFALGSALRRNGRERPQ